MRRWIVPGVLVMVASASAGTLAFSDSARWLWSYAVAGECQAGADCVASPKATVREARVDTSGMGEPPETVVTMEVQASERVTT